MAPVTYMPHAFNWWSGNKFNMPALPQVARPTYASLLEPVAANATGSTQAALNAAGVESPYQAGIGGRGQPESLPGIGMNAISPTFRDFASTVAFSPVGAGVSILGQAAVNAARGNPNAPITSAGLGGLWDAVTGGIGDIARSSGANFGVDQGAPPGPNTTGGTPDAPGAIGSDVPGVDPDYSTAVGDPGFYRTGGLIPHDGDRRMEPVPITAHEGEYVVRPEATKHYGRGLLDAINEKRIDKKKLKGLLG